MEQDDKNRERVIERVMKVATRREIAQDLAFLLSQLGLRENAQNYEEILAICNKYGWEL